MEQNEKFHSLGQRELNVGHQMCIKTSIGVTASRAQAGCWEEIWQEQSVFAILQVSPKQHPQCDFARHKSLYSHKHLFFASVIRHIR